MVATKLRWKARRLLRPLGLLRSIGLLIIQLRSVGLFLRGALGPIWQEEVHSYCEGEGGDGEEYSDSKSEYTPPVPCGRPRMPGRDDCCEESHPRRR